MPRPGAAAALLAALVLSGCAGASEAEERAQAEEPATPRSSAAAPATRPPTTPPPATPSTRATRSPRPTGPVLGADMSWPQCPKGMGIPEKRSEGMPLPLPRARFVVLGLTNGPAFTPNPCLADQVDWVREHHLMAAAYSVLSYPDAATLRAHGDSGPFDARTPAGRLSNVGYQQAEFNLATMRTSGLETPAVWLDVEPVPLFSWSDDERANAAVVRGAARGYTDAGYRIGFYSTQNLWGQVVGDLRMGLPEWRAAGQTSGTEAARRCGPSYSFGGGPAILGQWLEDRRDHNVTCPGIEQQLERWFTQY